MIREMKYEDLRRCGGIYAEAFRLNIGELTGMLTMQGSI